MILVALDCMSELLTTVRRTRTVGVNVLNAKQARCAFAFARKGGAAKFDGIDWELDHQLPRLFDRMPWFACQQTELLDGGDHVVVVARVVAAVIGAAAPMTYHGRTFGTHAAFDVAGVRSS